MGHDDHKAQSQPSHLPLLISRRSPRSRASPPAASPRRRKSAKATSHGQHGIDQERTRQIQEALIREHYLTGEPTGSWDQATKDALTRYQEANGWQTKSLPDSRALIKLGLGPDKKGLLNPDTAVDVVSARTGHAARHAAGRLGAAVGRRSQGLERRGAGRAFCFERDVSAVDC